MRTVKEVSKITGVSVRTLHHYDAMGVLKPTSVTAAGYRLYDDAALRRLQTILLLRELQFPLKEIREILDAPNFDPVSALEEQIQLLELRRDHLTKLIFHARQIQKTGVMTMDFSAFDTHTMDTYAAQAREKWGKTAAYREFGEKTAGQTREQMKASGDALMEIFARFGAIRASSPAGTEAQALVAQLQGFITGHYYTCTPEILQGLGQLSIAGDAMTANIDAAGGAGTAQFAHEAIEIYCKK